MKSGGIRRAIKKFFVYNIFCRRREKRYVYKKMKFKLISEKKKENYEKVSKQKFYTFYFIFIIKN